VGKKIRIDGIIGDGARSNAFPAVPSVDYSNWPPWREPESPLHVDKFLTAFASAKPGRRDSGRLRSPQELAALRIYCPYHYVRHSISMAINRGDLWVKFVQHHRAENPERRAKQKAAAELANAIKAFVKEGGIDWKVCHPTPLYSDRTDPEACSLRARSCENLEQALHAAHQLLEGHANQISADCDRIAVHGNAVNNAWKAGFAAELGFCWRNLTGKDPSLSTTSAYSFLSFVASAFISIGGDPKAKWDRTIRQVLHDRPKPAEWDGFDRYEQDRLPPGTQFVDAKEMNKKLDRMREQALQDARTIRALVANRAAKSR
jgi:hypothetical protein